MKAKQLPSGNYRVQVVAGYDENGKRIVKSFTAEKEWEALKKASDFLDSKNNEINLSITLRTAMRKYIDSRKNIVQETTIRDYTQILNNRFPNLMELQLKDLNPLIVQQEINRESEKISPKSIKCAYGLLKSVLKMYEVPINLNGILLPKIKKREIILPSFNTIFKIVQGTSIEVPVLLSVWLSLRIGEVLGLKFKDIDFQTHILHVRRTIIITNDGDKVREGCKTEKSNRLLQIPDYIFNLIFKMPFNDPECFLVPLTRKTLYRRFRVLMDKNDIHITFHDLRHLNASIMLMLGIPDKYAMERGGWSTDNVLKSVYQQTFSSERVKVDSIIDSYFDEIIQKDKKE